MYNIRIEDLENFADRMTIDQARMDIAKNGFPMQKIKIRENPNRYDTVIYAVEWNDSSEYEWYKNLTQIEVDVEDNIVSFYSECSCKTKYNRMCPHTVTLALAVMKMAADKKKAMTADEYREYEELQLREFQLKKQHFLERRREEQASSNRKVFSDLLSQYELLTKNVTVSEKIGIEPIIAYNDEYYHLSLKVGTFSKKYIIKNIYYFLNAIRKKELVRYGKTLEFYHDLNNFDNDARLIIDFLLLKTNYWSETSYLYDYSQHFRYLLLNGNLMETFLSLYEDHYINYIKQGIETDVYISSQPFEGKLNVDEEKITLRGVKNYQIILGEKKHFIEFDNTIYELIGVTESLKPLFRQLSKTPEIIIKDSFSTFLKEIYPLIYEDVETEYGFREKHPVEHVRMDSYFDLEDNQLTVETKYWLGEKEVNPEILERGIYSISRLREYRNFLKDLGFSEGKTDNLDNIMLFLKTDLSFLRKCGDVYLSESIRRTQIKKMKPVVMNLSYDVDIFSVCFNDLGFTDEELQKMIAAYKKRKKYVKLKQDVFMEINEKSMKEFVDLVEDFSLNTKELTKKQIKPLYTVAKALNKQNSDAISYYYNEQLREILSKIKNYKENEYQVPEALKDVLRPYQIEAFRWLKTLASCRLGGILADDMGLGKTLEIISFIISDEAPMPSLIICPTSLIFNWKNEIIKWNSLIDYTVITGNASDRKEMIENIGAKKQLIITSYDTFKNDVEEYQNVRFRFVVLDEAQFIKNYYTQKAQAVKQVQSEVRFVLTGTPIENSLLDLWSIFDFLMPDYLSTHGNFKTKYEKAIVHGKNQELLHSLIKKITPFVLRRTKKHVLQDLPDKFETISYAMMEEEQRKVYEAMLLATRNQLEAGKSKFEILSSLTRLRQICVDPALFLADYHGGSAKVDYALDLIRELSENGHKILLFSQFASLFPILEEHLKKMKIDYYILTGSTPAIERMQMVDDFNENDDVKVFLISLKAGGTGLNLIGADVIIHFDPWWNVSVENQATDRAHRIGQKRSVQVIKLVCENSIEQKVIELQNLKKDLADKIIADDERGIEAMDERDLEYLLS